MIPAAGPYCPPLPGPFSFPGTPPVFRDSLPHCPRRSLTSLLCLYFLFPSFLGVNFDFAMFPARNSFVSPGIQDIQHPPLRSF